MNVKIVARQSLIHGRLNLRKGEVAEVYDAVAQDLIRASLAEAVKVEQPVAPASKASASAPKATRTKKEAPPAGSTAVQTSALVADGGSNAPLTSPAAEGEVDGAPGSAPDSGAPSGQVEEASSGGQEPAGVGEE